MIDCCLGLIRGIWSFVIGSLRMLLFFMCLVYILIQTVLLALIFKADSTTHLTEVLGGARLRDFLAPICLILLGLVGAYGAFYRHHPSIRVFSFLSALSTLLLTFMILYTMGPAELHQQNTDIFHKMKGYMPDYSWDHDYDSLDFKRDQATKSWDGLQMLKCCGIKGPDDWVDYRPNKILYKDAYPTSCCERNGNFWDPTTACTKKDKLYGTGCSEALAAWQAASVIFAFMMMLFQLILTSISYVVSCCNFESRRPPQTMGMLPPRNATIYVDQLYQQPPVNRDFVDHPSAKHSLPPLYPNLHGSSHANYSSPPPSYGT